MEPQKQVLEKAKPQDNFEAENARARVNLGNEYIEELSGRWKKGEVEKQAELLDYKSNHNKLWDRFVRELNFNHKSTGIAALKASPTIREKGGFFHKGNEYTNPDYVGPEERRNHVEQLHSSIVKVQDALSKVSDGKYPTIFDSKNKRIAEIQSAIPDLIDSLDDLEKVTQDRNVSPKSLHLAISSYASDNNYLDLKDYFSNCYKYVGESTPTLDRDTRANEIELKNRLETEVGESESGKSKKGK